MSAAALYLETSALLRVLFEQGETAPLVARISAAGHLLTSRLTRIECERALLRLALDRLAPAARIARAERELAALLDRVEMLEITAEVAALAGRIAPGSPLRSLDAIHLASWQIGRRILPDLELVTTDRRLADAAGLEAPRG